MEAEAAPQQAPAHAAAPSALLQRLRVRLDDGSIVRAKPAEGGSISTEILGPAAAFKEGLLTEAHLLKAQALLCTVHATLPDEGHLRTVSAGSKRSADTRVEALSGKRSRSAGGPLGNGLHDTAAINDALESPRSVGPAGPGAFAAAAAVPQPPNNWMPIAERMVDAVLAALGKLSWIFHEPVDSTKVLDYYRIIKQPMCLKQVREKLRRRQYTGPQHFYSDMDLVWFNCFTYNRAGTEVHTLGLRGEAAWLQQWNASPFQGLPVNMRQRPTVMAAAPVYAAAAAPPKKQQRGPKSARAPPAAARQRVPPAPRAGPAHAGVARTKSVNSYRAYQALPPEKQQQLADALQSEDVMAQKMEGVVSILQQANELPTNENGEVELDLSLVSPATVWSLFEYIFGAQAVAAAAHPAGLPPHLGGAAARGSNFKLEEEDSEYEPDEDEDD